MGRLVEHRDGVFYGVAREGGLAGKGAVFVLYRKTDGSWDIFTLYSFTGPDGAAPEAGLVLADDGNFYGTTREGGRYRTGTVYRMTPSGRLVTLHSFSGHDGGNDGVHPHASLARADDGSLWGSTTVAAVPGTLFRITSSGTFQTMHRFASHNPTGTLLQIPDGYLYGTTSGTLFKVSLGGELTTLHTFDGDDRPMAGVIRGSDGNLYGTTAVGSIFRSTPSGETTTLYNFHNTGYAFGSETALVEASPGVFFGTTDGLGKVFRFEPGGSFSHVSSLGQALGEIPRDLMLARDGYIYGLSARAGSVDTLGRQGGFGAAFRFLAGGSPQALSAFASPMPRTPAGHLLEGADGALYGTSCRGGVHEGGTVFKITKAGAIETLHSFLNDHGYNDGWCPLSGLTRGADGNLYGTTLFGIKPGGGFQPSTQGRLFRISPSGAFTAVHQFSAGYAFNQWYTGQLTRGPEGLLYGTRLDFGFEPLDYGYIYRLEADDTVTIVKHLVPEDGLGLPPITGLLLASDGNLYGATHGIPNDPFPSEGGALFRMTPSGATTLLHRFNEDTRPVGRLVELRNGDLIGTALGGSTGAGVIFRASLAGAVTILHRFNFVDGVNPATELTELADGTLIGTTHGLRDSRLLQFGTIFSISPGGTFNLLRRFGWLDGANPYGALTLASDGALYGSTAYGGLGGGVIFRIGGAAAPAR